jgi:hypothetical protein
VRSPDEVPSVPRGARLAAEHPSAAALVRRESAREEPEPARAPRVARVAGPRPARAEIVLADGLGASRAAHARRDGLLR